MGWIEISSVVVAIVAIITIIIAAQRYNADRRSRIYSRLDEHKVDLSENMKREYARKDICALTHQQNARELKEIKEKVDLIPDIAAQVRILVNGRKT